MEYQTVIIEKKNGVGYLKLNRPEQSNSLTPEMSLEIIEILRQWKEDVEVRVIVIAAVGKAFCAGQAISPEVLNSGVIDLDEVLEKYFNPLLDIINDMPKVIICAVNGIAVGAGASLPLLCDITLAAKSASFSQIFSKIGLIPDCGATWLLPRLIGFAKAKALMLTAEKISAEEAERIGMIYKVVADDQLALEVVRLAEYFATQASLSFALIKQAMRVTMHNDFYTQIKVEQDLQRRAGQSEDFLEGVRAFLMKDQAHFKGR
ncbi:enoyl-CoA hydratase-related protein [Acinetobacter bereziniae]|uniref:2-(1,2-epoxy-1,2-dihydrophenyl)acetyl-CoA isomerase n=1 Tax=Acinetobacter bereziniae LMG 1003 = CIP 70.12 TaxID=981324 RepID=N9EGG5_ACIBZ|nr:enoyl-CoA hydratase-related protein [Acinetobacter bereziniae]ENV91890.1 hypothetical protein F938_03022 [Acinetobacter bereziniae LMG 1003 = CIP 70.12]MBJ9907624.1 enoyl-CoA hydratase/isomerase family protein [Acinetobacter bereziniae]MBJ9928933.1 enoyl-CoA hydratase/isomerase family protein [Acinetobacter bereziniae]MDG3556608.1 enoyl-CoA hydratase-related protein [Acinetobacter bereziniae]MDP6001557.1 enoyl-CoA hydratase-related protein [Acinetobacter bereziniae]